MHQLENRPTMWATMASRQFSRRLCANSSLYHELPKSIPKPPILKAIKTSNSTEEAGEQIYQFHAMPLIPNKSDSDISTTA